MSCSRYLHAQDAQSSNAAVKRSGPGQRLSNETPEERATRLHTLTHDMITQICVSQGLYRTPFCNDKLYLHHKALEAIDPHAFTAYTDVTVLWLEGNLLKSIPCGKAATAAAEASAADSTNSVCNMGHPSACVSVSAVQGACKSDSSVAAVSGASVCSVFPTAASAVKAAVPVEETEKGMEAARRSEGTSLTTDCYACKGGVDGVHDVFKTLYPTLRQLYLHNNLISEMPDLGFFQKLDSVNLSNNAIRRVCSGCTFWDGPHIQRSSFTADIISKSDGGDMKSTLDAVEHVDPTADCCGVSKSATLEGHNASSCPPPTSPSQHGDRERMEETMKRIDYWATICRHRALNPDAHAAAPFVLESTAEHDATEESTSRADGGITSFPRCPRRYADTALIEDEGHELGLLSVGAPQLVADDSALKHNVCLCSTLTTLNLSGNTIRSIEDLAELLCFKRLISLDLSNNMIEDGEGLLYLLSKLLTQKRHGDDRLRSLKLSGNPCVRTIKNYRKRVLAALPSLFHLDDRPVFDDERRLVSAWAAGGLAAERKERDLMRDEAVQRDKDRMEAFRQLIRVAREDRDDRSGSSALPCCDMRNGIMAVADSCPSAPVGDGAGDDGGAVSGDDSETSTDRSASESDSGADAEEPAVVEEGRQRLTASPPATQCEPHRSQSESQPSLEGDDVDDLDIWVPD